MRVAPVPNRDVLRYFARDAVQNLFPCYICEQRPDGSAIAAFRDHGICGAIASGRDVGLFAASNAWLAADDEEVATCLLRELPDRWRSGLEFPLRYERALADAMPNAAISKDLHLTREGAAEHEGGAGELVPIRTDALDWVQLPKDLAAWIGPVGELPRGFFGLAVDGTLVSLAESFVRYRDCASIQQVFAMARARQKGYARSLVSKLMQAETPAIAHWTWLAAAANQASIALASRLGFRPAYQLGCIEG